MLHRTASQHWTYIKRILRVNLSISFIRSLKCKDGRTQYSEELYITRIGQILNQHGYIFEKAPSQQPLDFRSVRHIKDPDTRIMIETKKTYGPKIKCNDSVPGFIRDTYNPLGLPEFYIILKVKKCTIIFVDDPVKTFKCASIQPMSSVILHLREMSKSTNSIEKRRKATQSTIEVLQRMLSSDYMQQIDESLKPYPRLNLDININKFEDEECVHN